VILALDAGNTKIVALVADESGVVRGAARRDECGDMYGAPSAAAAIAAIVQTADAACAQAGVSAREVSAVGAAIAGVDWDEDRDEIAAALRRHGHSGVLAVENDAFGTLWAALADGVGVAAVCGTGLAVCARSPERSYQASHWIDWTEVERQRGSGARALGASAIRAALSAARGLGPPTVLVRAALAEFALDEPEDLLHLITARANHGRVDLARMVPVLFGAAGAADAVATRIVRDHAAFIGAHVACAARGAQLAPGPTVVLGGGALSASGSEVLESALRREVQARLSPVRVVVNRRAPVLGAAVMAARALGASDLASFTQRLLAGAPPTSFFDTAPSLSVA
jgi:N-acetylglucosamine kinase-like BadF-type ATPase